MTPDMNFIAVDRHWFLTWTTYGSWLPGDRRGFVGRVLDESGEFINRNELGTPPAFPNEALLESSRNLLKSPPVSLNNLQARELLEQFQETSRIRGWLAIAIGIMRTHIHVVIGVPGDPKPETILGNFKAYGSRRLNKKWPKPASDTWWTTRGSTRKLSNHQSIEAVVNYIVRQPNPLLIWTREDGLLTRRSAVFPAAPMHAARANATWQSEGVSPRIVHLASRCGFCFVKTRPS